MRAKVSFLSRPVKREEDKLRTAVNRAAVISRDGQKFVFVLKGDRVVETPVKVGEPLGDMTEILEGAKPGEQVVLKPSPSLKNGSRIKPVEK